MLDRIDSFSDIMLVLCLLPMFYFAGRFSLGAPRTWFRDPLGWVIFMFNTSMLALLFLIVYGVVFGAPVDEPWRGLVATWVFISGCAKSFMLEHERAKGRLLHRAYADTGPISTLR